jgi:hypothetical protein
MPNSERTGAVPCERDTFSIGGRTTCARCPGTSFSNFDLFDGSSTCLQCEPGEYLDKDVDAYWCHPPKGEGWCKLHKMTMCKKCPIGTYAEEAVESMELCLGCPVGKYSNSLGTSFCTVVAAGHQVTFSEVGLRVGQEQCLSGNYSTGASDYCSVCGSGEFSVAGASRCSFCRPGAYRLFLDDGSLSCSPCPRGRFASEAALSIHGCQNCPQGKFSNKTGGASFCETVVAGFRSNSASAGSRTAQIPCQPGYFSSGNNDTCSSCESNGFSNEGSSTCQFCTPGKYRSVDATGSNSFLSCVPCVMGKYSETGANTIDGCLECPVGKFSGDGASFCQTVSAGSKTDIVNGQRIAEIECPKNSFSLGATDTCEECDGGHSKAGQASCVDTAPGYYWDEILEEDFSCAAGRFSETGAISAEGCGACADGFVSEAGQGYCTPCQAGRYAVTNKVRTDEEEDMSCGGGSFSIAHAFFFPYMSPF